MGKQRVEVVIKEELFKSIGLVVEKCFAYTDKSDSSVRIYGAIICEGEWDDKYYLKVKANLCDEEDNIVHIDYDFDKKTFIKVGYETFNINCYKGNNVVTKCVEIYPKLVKLSDGDDD